MKRLSLLFLGLAVMLGLSMTALAQNDPQIVFTDVPGPESSLTSGVGTGIYTGTVGGTTTSFICDDDLNNITQNESWNALTFNLNSAVSATYVGTYGNGQYAIPTVGGTPLGTSLFHATGDSVGLSVAQSYTAVAYLANLLLTKTYTSSGAVNAIQWAIWDIMDSPNTTANIGADPGGNCVGTYNPASGLPTNVNCGTQWVDYAAANELSYYNPYIVFYTPTAGVTLNGTSYPTTYAQEFIGETPEPISMALMGTFLSLAGFGLGKRKLFSKS